MQGELIAHGIGDTIFTHSRNIEQLLGYSNIYLKFEGGNPTGTMKDRAAYACLRVAKERGYRELAIASCGNFGASFVHLSRIFGITTHVYIPEKYHTPRIAEMERQGGVIHRAPGTYEEVVESSGAEAVGRGWYNANPGTPENRAASIEAYATIAYEIVDRMGRAPDAVAVPTSNGTTLAGINRGFQNLLKAGKTKKATTVIAASTSGGNPIVSSFLAGKRKVEDLKPSGIDETPINEPLVNWKSLDGQEALDALWESEGWAAHVADGEMARYSEIVAREEGLSVLPASCASLAALTYYIKEKNLQKGLDLVAFFTARNM
ncbi:MAG: pyridoxal-phosphate dependent enzyme [Candidatus Bathyarchaeota archaeon]|nr:pyridoxal-phosphate dependent enzyme [Candidatus Bathyarchaeota archaeon]